MAKIFPSCRLRATDMAFSPRGHLLYVATRGNIERLSWPQIELQFTWPAPNGYYNLMRNIAISSDGDIAVSNWGADIAVLSPNWQVRYYITFTQKELKFTHSPVYKLAPSPFKILDFRFDNQQQLWILLAHQTELYGYCSQNQNYQRIFKCKTSIESIDIGLILPHHKVIVYVSHYPRRTFFYNWQFQQTFQESYIIQVPFDENNEYLTMDAEAFDNIISFQTNHQQNKITVTSKHPNTMIIPFHNGKCDTKHITICQRAASKIPLYKLPSRTVVHAFHPQQQRIAAINVAGDLLFIHTRTGFITRFFERLYFPGYPCHCDC